MYFQILFGRRHTLNVENFNIDGCAVSVFVIMHQLTPNLSASVIVLIRLRWYLLVVSGNFGYSKPQDTNSNVLQLIASPNNHHQL